MRSLLSRLFIKQTSCSQILSDRQGHAHARTDSDNLSIKLMYFKEIQSDRFAVTFKSI